MICYTSLDVRLLGAIGPLPYVQVHNTIYVYKAHCLTLLSRRHVWYIHYVVLYFIINTARARARPGTGKLLASVKSFKMKYRFSQKHNYDINYLECSSWKMYVVHSRCGRNFNGVHERVYTCTQTVVMWAQGYSDLLFSTRVHCTTMTGTDRAAFRLWRVVQC